MSNLKLQQRNGKPETSNMMFSKTSNVTVMLKFLSQTNNLNFGVTNFCF